MDTTILNEVDVVDERPPDERTRVKGKDIKFSTGAQLGGEFYDEDNFLITEMQASGLKKVESKKYFIYKTED